MSFRGRRSWPPDWTWIGSSWNKPDANAGVLENVRLSAVNSCAILVSVSCSSGRYISYVLFDDANFCHQICELLKRHFGSPVSTIGELDFV
jgi:hypothetical protein